MSNIKPDLTLSVFSDLHITHFDEPLYDGYENLERALQFHQNELPASDAYLMAGDIFYHVESPQKGLCEKLYPEIYDRANSLFDTYLQKTPRYFVMGNHEYPQANMDPALTEAAQKLYMEKTGEALNFHRVVNGYHIIGASALNYRIPQSDSNEAYVMEEVEKAKAEAPDLPIFLMLHAQVPDTKAFLNPRWCDNYSDAFMNWLQKNPEIVLLSGHVHYIGEDDVCLHQIGYTQVNLPVLAVGYMTFQTGNVENFEKDCGTIFGKSQTVQISVYGSRVEIRCYDLKKKAVVNTWELDVAALKRGEGYLYTDEAHDAWGAPAFANDATVTVEEADGASMLAIRQSFLPYAHCKKYYMIDFLSEDGETVKSVTYPTDYYMDETADIIKKPIPALPAGKYTVTVYIANSFEKRSDAPISTVLSVKEA